MYTHGKLALPVVLANMGGAAVPTLATGIFTTLKTLENVQRFFEQMEQNRRTELTINVMAGKQSSQPLMREQE